MQYLHCVVKFQLRKLRRLCFNLVRNYRYAIAELRYASTESKSLLRKLRCASEIQKIKLCILRCAFTG